MRTLHLIATLAAVSAFGGRESHAVLVTVFNVNTIADKADFDLQDGVCDADSTVAGEQCSLRAAIQNANLLGTPVLINVPAGVYRLSRKAHDDTATNGDLDITGNVTIAGAGSATTIIDAKKIKDRVFDIRPGATGNISDLTITHGRTPGKFGDSDDEDVGGGIRNDGTLVLTQCKVSHCFSTNDGGGVDNDGVAATLVDCYIVANSSFDDGAGIDMDGADVTITGSTIAKNKAFGPDAESAGIEVHGGSLTMTNSTVSGNRAHSRGGGITCESGGVTMLRHVTIALNHAKGEEGISVQDSATMTIANCLLYKNLHNCQGSIQSFGGNVELGHSCGFGTGDKSQTDSKLAPLKNNGGPTPTHALKPGSGAIGAGNPANCEPTDQRGNARKTNCDSGAFETP